MANDNFLKVRVNNLRLLLEVRQDSLGKVSFSVSFDDKSVRFRSLDSVIDFINMNLDSLGYVK